MNVIFRQVLVISTEPEQYITTRIILKNDRYLVQRRKHNGKKYTTLSSHKTKHDAIKSLQEYSYNIAMQRLMAMED